ncbi:hypothetical protein GBF38_021320 [Nibea albiflora]|uniref:Uncharacterized protein n=1 Tax=Nibea albiflora TaxID=240163 RepID=A0ACB7FFU2_NIBAL|nr:hypothetical protein GBF38_021320 [Nibea albiflora]
MVRSSRWISSRPETTFCPWPLPRVCDADDEGDDWGLLSCHSTAGIKECNELQAEVYHCVCCLSEARHLEVNLIIHVSCYSLSSILSRRDPSADLPRIQLVHGKGRSQRSEPHLAQGWEIFVFIRTDRAAPLTALLSLLSLGKTVTLQSMEEKLCAYSDEERIEARSSHGEVSVLAAPLDLATQPRDRFGYVKITGCREETRAAACSVSSRVSQPPVSTIPLLGLMERQSFTFPCLL